MDIHSYYKQMQSNGIVMSYKGAASGDLLNSIIAIAQTKLTEIEQRSSLKKKVFSILVEILQNIYHHFDDIDAENIQEDDSIIFILAKTDVGYSVVTGNYVAVTDVPPLKARIDSINSMTSEELKVKYRETLDTGKISEKGGAGLGIIDIARKSGGKLEYEFSDGNNNFSFFSLTVKIAAI